MRLFSVFLHLFMIALCVGLLGCDAAKPTIEEACSGFDRDHTKDVYFSETTKNNMTTLRIVMVGLAKVGEHQGGDPIYNDLQNRIDIMQRTRATCPPLTKSKGQYRSCKQKDKATGYPYRAIDYNVTCPAKPGNSVNHR